MDNGSKVDKTKLQESIVNYNIHYADYYYTVGFKFRPDPKAFENIDSVIEGEYKKNH